MFIIDVKSHIELGNTSLSAWIVEHPFLQPKIKNRYQETADFSSEFGAEDKHEFYLTTTPLKLRKF